ncbi:hypothetical protein I6J22_04955 [Corynebacterium kroppenstedtii]|uniref:Uncharacterized protein n=1 Tax=Corynebacterium kroppenstedtii (strain DSM 44385 / JCM 11950 / CIP 105744 / CCUG 35717) TaxID=645127 RepID=C4LGY8_CORK4|nr:hypothetical protein [Corynebacterium kroppenstedtii]ACR17093.1 hypothetical protein ckrop_0311 [Corynebacterium kroppenstedtii DSM 44385]QRP11388.1 hypothetical protein I6J22_04955 [Corynebacterium kroppenstedtii]HJD68166.1 hypothetical protein [Corynebacterium kroppenstedtii]
MMPTSPCETPHLSDAQIAEAFMDAVHMLPTESTSTDKIVEKLFSLS